ncbi:MAG: FAD-dependent oxidoreductase [Firmicutes bacterium]|nr:FAD-dependent oxidoreductase [Bacillota bacterium]MDY6159811.1 FAD-dependent oxidoreductase [Candidatus Faecousia sp.]
MIDEKLKNRALNPVCKGDPAPREKILKLGKKVTDVVLHKLKGITTDDPEYWGLAAILTDEMADIALSMDVRVPYTLPQLMKMNNITEEGKAHFEAVLEEMSYIGLLEFDYGYHYDHNGRTAPPSEKRYILTMFVPGSAEMFNMEEADNLSETPSYNERGEISNYNKRLHDEHPEVGYFFERMTYIPLEGVTHLLPPGGGGVGMHVIPVEKAIEMENTSVDLEHLSYWLKKYEGHIGVGQCSCRASRGVMGEGCADDPSSWCIGVGDFADYCRETGKGHDITYEEAMHILQVAEDNGFVHQVTNIDGENKIFGICNCNVKICNALRTSQLFNTPNLSRSAYTAEVDKAKCVACGKCVEYCPAGAVKLGQKLCDKQGKTVEYPKHELPHGLKWGPEHWDPDYRDNNRKNCYDKGTAPCKTACPAHIAVQGYLKLAAQGRYTDALALIKKDNPFPAVCGRICNKRCEDACTRGTIDEAVSIDAVKKFIAQKDLDAKTRYIPPVVIASNRVKTWAQKIAIIGGGPAGLSAAYYLATIGYKPTVFEKSAKPGGMMMYGIPSFKLEKDVIDAEIDVLRELGVEIKCGVEVGRDVTIQQLRDQGYEAFYIAIGCQGGRRPGVPGDQAAGTSIAVDFLHHALEDESQRMEGNVVVVGGGNVAVDCVKTAKRFGAAKVSMVCLEDRASMPASKNEIAEALEENIAICNSWGPKEVKVDAAGHVTAIVFKKCLRTMDENGKFNPAYDENDTMTLEADHIVFAIGQAIEWGSLLEGTKVEFWRGNYPVADPLTYQTAEPDIFVGGDVYHGPKFVIDAIEEGKCAAESLHRYVHKGADMKIGRNRRDFIMLDKDDIYVDSYDHAGRQEAGMDETIDPHSFRDAHKTLTEEQVKIETARCLGCGASWVDPNKCIGCGVCTTKCMFDAIHLKRDHPECTDMRRAEDKIKVVASMAVKRLGEDISDLFKKKD